VRALIGEPELHAGLLAGLVGLVLAAGLAAAWSVLRPARPRDSTGPPGLFGAVFVVATVAGIGGAGPFTEVWPVPARAAVGLIVLWVAGQIGRPGSYRQVVATALAIVGGILLIDSGAEFPAWVIALLVLGPALGGAAAADVDRRGARSGTGPLLLGIAVVGLFVTVPDTELALVLVGVTIPMTLLAWPWPRARLGGGGAYAAVGIFLWVATLEGAGRPGSTVGAAAALGVLVLEPVGRTLSARLHAAGAWGRIAVRPERVASTGALVAAQVLAAAWAGRVAGMVRSPTYALVLAIPAVLGALAATTRYRPSDPATPPPRSRSRPGRHGSSSTPRP